MTPKKCLVCRDVYRPRLFSAPTMIDYYSQLRLDALDREGASVMLERATMSLARLLAKQRKRDEARTMLAKIYNWFTEGFDTAHLIDAKSLLDQLRAQTVRLPRGGK